MDFNRDFYFESDSDRRAVRHIAELALRILEDEHQATDTIGNIIDPLQILDLYDDYSSREIYPTDDEIRADIRAQLDVFAPDYPTDAMRERFKTESHFWPESN